ncbi:MAG: TfoX/Sxy family protein [Bacteroidia bacterium]|nr:TfoX/Sxy family protein [Bacteroidia bacterium]
MAYSEQLAQRLRDALEGVPRVEEKRMFGRLAFMVNGKMCVTAGPQRIMARIDLALHNDAIKNDGCKTVIMRGRPCLGYVHVAERNLDTDVALQYWVNLALDFNKKAKAATRRAETGKLKTVMARKDSATPLKKAKRTSKIKK